MTDGSKRRVTCRSVKPGRRTSAAAFSEDLPEADDPLLGFAPYIHTAPRRNSITPERQRTFIAELAATGIVTQAARAVGVSLEALYKLRHRAGAEEFSAAWETAIDRGMARLEDCALERAIQGEERPVVWDGQVVTSWKKYDTALLIFLLRQRRGWRYGAPPTGLHALGPGHPVYERMKAEWMAEGGASVEDVRASIDQKLRRLRETVEARWAEEAAAEEAGMSDEAGREDDDLPEQWGAPGDFSPSER